MGVTAEHASTHTHTRTHTHTHTHTLFRMHSWPQTHSRRWCVRSADVSWLAACETLWGLQSHKVCPCPGWVHPVSDTGCSECLPRSHRRICRGEWTPRRGLGGRFWYSLHRWRCAPLCGRSCIWNPWEVHYRTIPTKAIHIILPYCCWSS